MPIMVTLTVLHTVVGALLFGVSVLLVLFCYRLVPRHREVARHLAAAGGHLMSTARTAELTLTYRASAFITLTKPDVSFLVLITTAAGYYMGARGPVNWLHMLHAVFATMLIAAGTATLNHYIERDSDRFMRRTAGRPLPTGVVQPREALLFGVSLSIAGAVDLYFVGGLCRARSALPLA